MIIVLPLFLLECYCTTRITSNLKPGRRSTFRYLHIDSTPFLVSHNRRIEAMVTAVSTSVNSTSKDRKWCNSNDLLLSLKLLLQEFSRAILISPRSSRSVRLCSLSNAASIAKVSYIPVGLRAFSCYPGTNRTASRTDHESSFVPGN
jgi:hypothetical protein